MSIVCVVSTFTYNANISQWKSVNWLYPKSPLLFVRWGRGGQDHHHWLMQNSTFLKMEGALINYLTSDATLRVHLTAGFNSFDVEYLMLFIRHVQTFTVMYLLITYWMYPMLWFLGWESYSWLLAVNTCTWGIFLCRRRPRYLTSALQCPQINDWNII